MSGGTLQWKADEIGLTVGGLNGTAGSLSTGTKLTINGDGGMHTYGGTLGQVSDVTMKGTGEQKFTADEVNLENVTVEAGTLTLDGATSNTVSTSADV